MPNTTSNIFQGLQFFNDHIGRPNTVVATVLEYANASKSDATLATKVATGATAMLSAIDLMSSYVKSLPGGVGVGIAAEQLRNDVIKLVYEGTGNTGNMANFNISKVSAGSMVSVTGDMAKLSGKVMQMLPSPQTKAIGLTLDFIATGLGYVATGMAAVSYASGQQPTESTTSAIGQSLTSKQQAESITQNPLNLTDTTTSASSFSDLAGGANFGTDSGFILSSGDILGFASTTTGSGTTGIIRSGGPTSNETYTSYTIQAGDTVSQIEKRFGMPTGSISKINKNITNPDLIFPGQKIQVKKLTSASQDNSGITTTTSETVSAINDDGVVVASETTSSNIETGSTVTSTDSNGDGEIDGLKLKLVNAIDAAPYSDIDGSIPTTTSTKLTLSTDFLSLNLSGFRSTLLPDDPFLIDAQEIRLITGAQSKGEVWGGARALEFGLTPLSFWYNNSSADYAGQLSSNTVDNPTLDNGLNGLDSNFNSLNAGAYDGLGLMSSWNLGSNTSFASFGASGTGETTITTAPTFDSFWSNPITFDPYVPVDTVLPDPFPYVGPTPFNDPGIPEYTDYDPYSYFAPVVLDLDGDGIELIDQKDSHAYFAVKANDVNNRYNVGWVGADDGMLAIDKNGDGQITQADELSFALWTADTNDTDIDGLKAVFDTNKNGQLDSGDARYGDMRIWRDLNGDGVSDAGELQTLATAGIVSLNLTPARTNWANGGNLVTGFSTFKRSNGVLGWAGDVSLGYQPDGWAATTQTNFVKVSQTGGLTYGLAKTGTTLNIDLNAQGVDGAIGSTANDALNAGARKAVLLEGGAGNDTLTGGTGDDWLNGGDGIDSLIGGDGDDTIIFDSSDVTINGGAGIDVALASGINSVKLDLGATGFEAAVGSDGADNLYTTGTGRVILAGQGGNDQLSGGANSDMLDGGLGTDTLVGGKGDDVYVFGRGDGVDQIKDEAIESVQSIKQILTPTIHVVNDPFGDIRYMYAGQYVDLSYPYRGCYTLAELYELSVNYQLKYGGNSGLAATAPYSITWTGKSALYDYMNIYSDGDGGRVWGGNVFTLYGTTTYYTNEITNVPTTVTTTVNAGNDTIQLGANIKSTDLDAQLTGNDLTIGLINWNVSGTAVADMADRITILNQVDNLKRIENIRFADGTSESTANWRLGGIGNDTLTGDALANHLFGAAGNDWLDGGSGADTMVGGLGDDTYVIDDANDAVVEASNSGTDTVRSSLNFTLSKDVENLVLTGGVATDAKGNDSDNIITGNTANNVIDGGLGADSMSGGAGDDAYTVDSLGDRVTEALNEGKDTVKSSVDFTLGDNLEALILTGSDNINATGNTLGNSLTGNAGANAIDGKAGADTMAGGAGDDSYVVDDIGDVINELSGEGSDNVLSYLAQYTLTPDVETLTLGSAANVLKGTGNGLDNRLYGNAYANTLDGGAGNDSLNGGAGNDTLTGGLGDDTYYINDANDTVIEKVGEGSDRVISSMSFNLQSAANVENLRLSDTTDINATGNGLENNITGNTGANVLDGGAGNDTLGGLEGNDTYLFGKGYGKDVVYECDVTTGNSDTLKLLAGVASTGVTLSREGYVDLLLTINSTGDQIKLINWFAGPEFRVEKIIFADEPATIWDTAAIMRLAQVKGAATDDILVGDEGNDTFDGMAGNDTLIGSAGNDTYLFGAGSGQDLIIDQDATAGNLDTLRITGTTLPTGVTLSRSATDLYLTLNASNERITVQNWFVDASNQIERIEFAASTTVWTATDILNAVKVGSAASNTITGDASNNVLDGGAGADNMAGGAGDDIYIVDNIGDMVTEAVSAGTDLVRSSVTHTLLNNVENLELTGADTISGYGNSLANKLTGNAASNTLDGGAGNDTMQGGAGDDTYYVDSSGDVVTEFADQGVDAVFSYIDYSLTPDVENLYLTGSTALTATGNILGNFISGNALNNTLNGGAGNDSLDGGAGNDVMAGGQGDDRYYVRQAGDTVIEAANEGIDTIRAYVNVDLRNFANVERVSISGTGNLNVIGNDLDNRISGNLDANTLSGAGGSDDLTGGDGNDTLDGGAGIDYLAGGFGADTYNFGKGNGKDYIFEEAESGLIDTIKLAADILPGDVDLGRQDNDLTLTIRATGDQLVVVNWFAGLGTQVEQIVFNNGTIWQTDVMSQARYMGTSASEYVTASDAADSLDGLAGDDSMLGGEGDDTYYFGRGDGHDVIYEYNSAGVNSDKLRFKTGLKSSDITLSRDVDSLIATINDTQDSIRIEGWFTDATLRVEQFIFDDATWSTSTLQAAKVLGTTADDTLSIATGSATFDGKEGNDSLYGSTGDDAYIFGRGYGIDAIVDAGGTSDKVLLPVGLAPTDVTLARTATDLVISINGTDDRLTISNWFSDINQRIERIEFAGGTVWDAAVMQATNLYLGTAASDSIIGTAGADVMDGRLGADAMIGDQGNDTYRFGRGYGQDSIVDGDTTAGNIDTVVLNADVTSSDVTLIRSGNDLVLSINGSADQLTMIGWFYATSQQIERITFNEGTVWDAATISQMALTGTDGDEVLTGGLLADIIYGGAGNDTLNGAAGDDNLVGGSGIDSLIGGTGNDYYEVDNASDVIFENESEGIDLVSSNVDFVLSANVDNLVFTGSTDLTGEGNALDNSLNGNTGNNTLYGGGGNDVLTGDAGNDELYGDAGIDTLIGGEGSDTYYVDDTFDNQGHLTGTDLVLEYGTSGVDTVTTDSTNYALPDNIENLVMTSKSDAATASGNLLNNDIQGSFADDNISGLAGDDTISGMDGADLIYGNDGNDVLSGDLGKDTLDGGAGVDVLTGGDGDDSYVVDDTYDAQGNWLGVDSVIETASGGTDLVMATSDDYTLDDNVENLVMNGKSGSGNALNNQITGYNDANKLYGKAGNDTLFGLDGDDELAGDEGDDRLEGGFGDDTLNGGIGADVLIGGVGNDIYVIDQLTDVVTENAGEGTDTIQTNITYSIEALGNIERLTLTGSGVINATGNTGANVLIGNSAANTLTGAGGDDTLDGGAGTDSLIGGIGNDTYVVDQGADVITENAGEGTDTVKTAIAYSIAALTNVENLTLTGAGAVNATGNTGANVLTGNTGANVLDGGAGIDTLIGGAGNDIYVVDLLTDVVTENVGEGTDTIQTGITYSIAALTNVENLTLTGSGLANGTGNAGTNVLTGNAAANILDGGTGIDTLIGGAGNDIYVVDVAADVVTENAGEGTDTIQTGITYSIAALANIENLTLTGTGIINATGNTGANVLTGNAAANVLDGGAGIDTLIGGLGNDTYVVDVATDVVTENAGEGTDTIQTGITYSIAALANIENLTLTGTGIVNATGNAGANALTGNAAANVLDGGAGIDTLIGGLGNDTYVVDLLTDVITENSGEGTDTIQTGITYSIATLVNVENLTLTGTSLVNATGNGAANTLTGNGAANTLTGAGGDDMLNGGAGADILIGGLGNDTYIVDLTTDVVTENAGEGTDTIQTGITYSIASLNNIENLSLTGTSLINATGNSGANVLTGNGSANTLTGGGGNDTYRGGAGNDTLISSVAASNDTYIWGRGEGADALSDAGGVDQLQVLAGVTADQVWLRHVGNNLELSVIGTTDTFNINNWYTAAANQVETFKLADGKTLQAANAQKLVDAMAVFAPPTAGQTTLPANYQSSLSPTIATNWV